MGKIGRARTTPHVVKYVVNGRSGEGMNLSKRERGNGKLNKGKALWVEQQEWERKSSVVSYLKWKDSLFTGYPS